MEEPKRKGNGLSIFLLILLLLVVGAGAYLYFSGKVVLASDTKCVTTENEKLAKDGKEEKENTNCIEEVYEQAKNISNSELMTLYANMVSRSTIYTIADINKDDIPELIVSHDGAENATKEYTVYTYDENNTTTNDYQKLVNAGTFSNTDGMVYLLEDGTLLSFSGIQCVETQDYYNMYKGNLVRNPEMGGTKNLGDGRDCEYSKAPEDATELTFKPSSDHSLLDNYK